jgi:STE24 endopeptidase
MAQTILYFIIAFVLFEFIVSKILDKLNMDTWQKPIPEKLKDLYEPEQYEKAKEYAIANNKVGTLSSFISLAITLCLLYFKGFAYIDSFASTISEHYILRGLVFLGILGLGSMLIGLPFGLYQTFVIEEKFGFNKTSLKTFILDKVKGIIMGVLIGGGLYALLCWLFKDLGGNFWLIGWTIISAFTIFLAMFYTSLILPLFNKLVLLESGELRSKIEDYSSKVTFPLTNIFIMDGSKRSAKANAFFSGLGAKKNIVLYDTLVNQLNQEEITAVLAHEVGHYKKKHITKAMFISVFQLGFMFFVFGQLANSPILAEVLGATENSFHLSIITFSLLFSPISMITGILSNLYARKNEYEADAYAKETFAAEPLVTALKKMTVNHLSNPQPHPAYIFVHYSHPTMLQRMEALGL